MKDEDLFHQALDQPPQERDAFLQAACDDDAGLRARVENLLRAHANPRSFLQVPAGAAYYPTVLDRPITESAGTTIGPYKLLEQIGEGGFGVVFMAEQTQPVRRRVALKVIKPGMDTRQVIARFEAERQALALMDHPNIAKVLEAGATETGRPYFVMELVRGVPITEYCDEQQLTPHERLELFVTVCHAVQHAHQKGIIHRDIKPTNVLITLHDDKPVVKVIDFGVAKAVVGQLTEKTLFTGFAQMIGTPLYMSPEQAAISGLDVDTRSDIYSLGVLLYELLTGTTPFDKERFRTAGYDEIRRIIREEEPVRPSTRISTLGRAAAISATRKTDPQALRCQCRGELDWIVMKCLEKDRNRRYDTPAALAADVRRFLTDEPVQACPPSTAYRFRKFARRNKRGLATATLLGVMLLVAVGAVVASALWAADQARARLDVEAATKKELERNLYFTHVALAERELSANKLGRALKLLGECPKDLRGWEWHYLMRLCRVEPVIARDKSGVNSIAFSPDGERLASASGDGAIKLWNSRTGWAIRTLERAHSGFACSVAFHPDGNHLASVGADKQVKIWDLTTGEEVFARPCDAVAPFGTAYAAAFSPDGRQLAAGSAGTVSIWDWRNHQILHTFRGHDTHRISLAFSRDGRRLASGHWRGSVQLWDAVGGAREPLCTFPKTSPHPVVALAFSPDGRRLATANFGRRVDVWDTTTGRITDTLPHPGALVLAVAFSPDGRRLATAGEDKTVHIWDAVSGRELLGLRGHTSPCGCVAFSPDGQRLASASMDGTIRIWDAAPLEGHEVQETLTLPHSNEVWSVALKADGQKIVSAGFGTLANVWDVQTGNANARFSGHKDVVFCVTWHPDGRRIASAGADGQLFTVKVWDALTGIEDFALPAIAGNPEFFAAAFSPRDGQHLVTGRRDGVLQVWDARTGTERGTIGGHDREIRGVVFSPIGGYLASVSGDGVVKLWDATRLDKKPEARILTDRARVPGPCLNLAFSPDGRRLATVGEQNTVEIWDVQTGNKLKTIGGRGGDIYTVAFSPDPAGRWVASAGEDSTVKVWDSHTGTSARTLRGHTGLVTSIAFTADGRRLVSGSRDKTVKVWDVSELSDSEREL